MSTEKIKKRAKEIGNQPAFPCSADDYYNGRSGMTKREKLAFEIYMNLLNKHGDDETWATCSVERADAIFIALAESEVNNG